jgi:hypothetical protein
MQGGVAPGGTLLLAQKHGLVVGDISETRSAARPGRAAAAAPLTRVPLPPASGSATTLTTTALGDASDRVRTNLPKVALTPASIA